jgi:SAM-dependent methyltransferase
MAEINLLESYPRSRRPMGRSMMPGKPEIAKRYGREYFDGDRTEGYGGYRYDGRWVPIARRISDHYGLTAGKRVLDIGCAKGFLIHDLKMAVPGLSVVGLDVSEYALIHAMPDTRGRLVRGSADQLPFRDGEFDLVLSINVLHNLERGRCITALREIGRVGRGHSYVQVDSWLSEEQRENLAQWVLTAVTYYDPDGWRELFAEAEYTGDYFWTLTE